MDEKQAERILAFGFVEALLAGPNGIQVFRVIEPPDVTLATNVTASPAVFTGGPFLVNPSDAAKVAQVKNMPDFKHVTVGVLTSEQVLNNIVRHGQPMMTLLVKGEPPAIGVDAILDAMKIRYTVTNHTALAANPDMIFSYTAIVVDSNGWEGNVPSQIASNFRTYVSAGEDIIFTDRALLDLNAIFPGYVTLSGPQPTGRVSAAYCYNPPRKYDPSKYGASADRLKADAPSQYYNPPPSPNEINFFTPTGGIVVSSVASAKVNDVRILIDSNNLGPAGNQYGILAFHFTYGIRQGLGLVKGLVAPQQQTMSQVREKGNYAIYQLFGNEIMPWDWRALVYTLEANPTSITTAQGTSVSFRITVNSFYTFNSSVLLGLSDLPLGATYSFDPPAPQPPAGGTASSTLLVNVPLSTPNGTYVMNVTGTDTSTPSMIKSVAVTLTVTTTVVSATPSTGFAFAIIGIGAGVAAAAGGLALAMSGQHGSEVAAYGGYYYCRKHRVPLLYVEGRLWCPVEQRELRS